MAEKRQLRTPKRIHAILNDEEADQDDLITAMLYWSLWKATKFPEETTPGQMAQVIDAASKFRAVGGGSDGGLKAFLTKLDGDA